MEPQRDRSAPSERGLGRVCRRRNYIPRSASVRSVMRDTQFPLNSMGSCVSYLRLRETTTRDSVIPIVGNGKIEM